MFFFNIKGSNYKTIGTYYIVSSVIRNMLYEINQIAGIRLCYYFAKIHGLIPFDYNYYKQNSSHPILSTIYFFCILTVLSGFLIYSQMTAIIYTKMNDDKTVVELVFLMEVMFGLYRSAFVYFFQFYHRRKYIQLIDDAICIQKHLNKLNKVTDDNGLPKFDKKIRQHCATKVYVLLIQNVIIISKLLPVSGMTFSISDFVSAFFVTYSCVLKTLITFAFFMSQLVLVQFFRNLTCHLYKMANIIGGIELTDINQMKMQVHCELSDDCDGFTALFKMLTEFRTTVWRFFEFQLVLALIDAFVVILSEVNGTIFYLSCPN